MQSITDPTTLDDPVRVDRSGPVAIVRLNRPERLNALRPDDFARLAEVVDAVQGDSTLTALILTGASPSFCAGGDVKARAERLETAGAPDRSDAKRLRSNARLAETLLTGRLLSIAAIDGPCVGAGLSLACACHVRVASQRSIFKWGFLDSGLSGDYGSAHLLTSIVGRGHAAYMAALERRVSASHALSMGLISEIWPDEMFTRRFDDLVRTLKARDGFVLHRTLANLGDAEHSALPHYLDREAERQLECSQHLRSRKRRAEHEDR